MSMDKILKSILLSKSKWWFILKKIEKVIKIWYINTKDMFNFEIIIYQQNNYNKVN